MNLIKYLRIPITIAITLFVLTFSHAQQERNAGEVTLSFRTVTANGNYAPKHVLAVWVEDDSGFIKSRLVRANNRKQYLYTWISASNYNETDVWDCAETLKVWK